MLEIEQRMRTTLRSGSWRGLSLGPSLSRDFLSMLTLPEREPHCEVVDLSNSHSMF